MLGGGWNWVSMNGAGIVDEVWKGLVFTTLAGCLLACGNCLGSLVGGLLSLIALCVKCGVDVGGD